MTGNYQSDLVTLLLWFAGVCGSSLILISLWVARRLVSTQDDIRKDLLKIEENLAKELESVREVFHDLDKRIIRLETWRDSRTAKHVYEQQREREND